MTKVERLKKALLAAELMNETFFNWIADGTVDADYVKFAYFNFRRALQPPTPKFSARYVLGFAFDKHSVLVLRKKRPSWQAGKLNGVGGKIEDDETPLQAMNREFAEEAGLIGIKEVDGERHERLQWRQVGRRFRTPLFDEQVGSYEMFVFAIMVDDVRDLLWERRNRRVLEAPNDKREFLWQEPTNDENIFVLPYDSAHIGLEGVAGLVWTVEAARCALEEHFTFSVEDPADMSHLVD